MEESRNCLTDALNGNNHGDRESELLTSTTIFIVGKLMKFSLISLKFAQDNVNICSSLSLKKKIPHKDSAQTKATKINKIYNDCI